MKARVIAVCICAPDCTAIVAKVAYEIADIQVSILIKVKVIRMNVMKEVRLENLPLALTFWTDDEYSPCLEICCENVTVLMDGKSNHAGILVAPDYRLLPFGGDLHDLRPGTFALAEQQIAISIEDRAFRGVAWPGRKSSSLTHGSAIIVGNPATSGGSGKSGMLGHSVTKFG